MNKYVVAFWSDHTGELLQEIVEADNKVSAAISYLQVENENFNSMEEIQVYCNNGDTAINVLAIERRNHSVFGPKSPIQPVALQ